MDGDEEDDRGVDHQPVGEWVGHLAELRLDLPAAREPAVHLVGDAGDREDDRRRPAVPPSAGMSSAMKSGISASRRIVSAFGICASGAETAGADTLSRIIFRRGQRRKMQAAAARRRSRFSRLKVAAVDRLVPICSDFVTDTFALSGYDRIGEEAGRTGLMHSVAKRLTIPGFVNAHSHAFQRALRGRTEAATSGPGATRCSTSPTNRAPTVRSDYEQVYREMRAAGYTAVGEFHYLGFEQALAAAEAADAAGITFVLLYVAYARGGLDQPGSRRLPST